MISLSIAASILCAVFVQTNTSSSVWTITVSLPAVRSTLFVASRYRSHMHTTAHMPYNTLKLAAWCARFTSMYARHYQEHNILIILSPKEQQRYHKWSLSSGVASSPDLQACPTPDCQGVGVVNAQLYQCSICMCTWCSKCKLHHPGKSCEEARSAEHKEEVVEAAGDETSFILVHICSSLFYNLCVYYPTSHDHVSTLSQRVFACVLW